MDGYGVSASALVSAPPTLVYRILADYRQHHPHILPREYFRRIELEAGGNGAGTRMRVEMRLLGTEKVLRLTVSEPERGRELAETDVDGGSVTTFTVEPDARGSRVTITTVRDVTPGVRGVIERVLAVAVLRRVYRKELQLLAKYAADFAGGR